MTEKSIKNAKETDMKATGSNISAHGAKTGDKVKVHYTGTLDDGSEFDSSEKHGAPLEFQVGSKQLIAGFDNAVIGMKPGDEKQIKLKPSEAYGEPNPSLVQTVPRQGIQGDGEPKKGMMLLIGTPDGRKFPAMITEVLDDTLTLDLNHPLAGKNLNFKIKLIEIIPAN